MKIGVVLALTSSAIASQPTFTFQPITTCAGCSTELASINNAGTIGGQTTDTMGVTHGLIRIGGVNTTFDVPGASFTELAQVNNQGVGAGDYVDAMGIDRPFIRQANGTLTTPPLAANNATVNYLFGANHAGLFSGSYTTDPTGATGLIGFTFNGTNYTPFALPFPNVTAVFALGMNNAGTVVGSYKTGDPNFEHGFVRMVNGTAEDVFVPGSQQTEAFGINNDGSIVGRYEDASGIQHGYLLMGGVFTTVDYVDANQDPNTYTFGINDKNQIVGWSFPADNSSQSGFLATPVPEPGTFLLLGLGFYLVL